MKKLLSLIGAISLIATSSTTVIACESGGKDREKEIDYETLVKKLKMEVNEIFTKHLDENVYKNLIGIPDTETAYSFLTQTKIMENSNKSAEELDPYDLELLEQDIKKVLELDQLISDLNQLKIIDDYKVILNDVDNLLKNVLFDWSSLKILSYESNDEDKLYLGNVLVNYKVEIQFKGEEKIETFIIDEDFKYTSTNSNSLKKANDDFSKNIAKDYFLSNNETDRRHTNLSWDNIKGNKKSSDGFGRIDEQLKKYYQTDSETNGFKKSIIDFTKVNYFDKQNNKLPLLFEGEIMYKTSEMNKYSMSSAVNKWKSFNDSESIKYDYKEDDGRILLDTVFREDPEKITSKNNLSSYYFKNSNLKIWKKDYENIKDDFLRSLNIDLNNKIKEKDEYKKSTALGYVNLTGLSINLGKGAYIHQLPDFKIAVNYSVDFNQSDAKILDEMSHFTLDTLKVWHEVFKVYHGYPYPKHNSDEDFLIALKKSELTKEMTEIFPTEGDENKSSQVFFRDAFSLSNTKIFNKYHDELFEKANILENSWYYMVFASLDSLSPSERKNTAFDWSANNKIGINLKWNNNNQTMNNQVMTFRFGYLNFHIDLNKITMGAKELGNKELVKFI
ncbi:lipoprotein [Spiroplasma cantharicola]|uniref:Lipoprotein n=1 Tax=Spiroplasma cantharicola TaxID=362837 RepID=A0A0M5KJ99_9MOLU|nr:lipoprotein [Spiroplasma cantharicola]ALD66569.1 hypothetical protein SCANT_v1c06630 [Spiroplasma cantharicola]